MIDTRAVSKELQDLQHQIAGRIRKSQESVVGAIKTWTQAAQAVRPQIPSMPKAETLTARLPKPETLTARLPKAETLVTGAYDLAGQFVAGQRKLAGQIAHSARPLARQGAAMLGYGAALPGHDTAGSGRPDQTAKAPQSAKAAPAKAAPSRAKATPSKAKPAKAKPAKARTTKAQTAKATPARAAAAQKSTGAAKARSAKK
jgi:hypothetical protein